jgi:hypothetical protein
MGPSRISYAKKYLINPHVVGDEPIPHFATNLQDVRYANCFSYVPERCADMARTSGDPARPDAATIWLSADFGEFEPDATRQRTPAASIRGSP